MQKRKDWFKLNHLPSNIKHENTKKWNDQTKKNTIKDYIFDSKSIQGFQVQRKVITGPVDVVSHHIDEIEVLVTI
jgi:hypothetical protein